MKALRGAPSIVAVQKRRMRSARAEPKRDGMGRSARQMAEGRCVKAMVLMLPIRCGKAAANRLETAEIIEVVKKVLPSTSEPKSNLEEKK